MPRGRASQSFDGSIVILRQRLPLARDFCLYVLLNQERLVWYANTDPAAYKDLNKTLDTEFKDILEVSDNLLNADASPVPNSTPGQSASGETITTERVSENPFEKSFCFHIFRLQRDIQHFTVNHIRGQLAVRLPYNNVIDDKLVCIASSMQSGQELGGCESIHLPQNMGVHLSPQFSADFSLMVDRMVKSDREDLRVTIRDIPLLATYFPMASLAAFKLLSSSGAVVLLQ
ncbi:hypothetical protein SARC_01302 [Sphaeroforma arctica JP610]|uniref:Uncharacterized protein n=1 Tax=Sphaeroforma arctica JP610 TaxID=667725 RepID=A0A0L0GC90_9EUKA|nr:hypothetical protein SARC_01302 [Sphaeroforma arctica JP610]KNC86529.1 hypothetical protein SARC_01302 [Sphaeroforma arctica JP610]|eukprot:XP_014160431.1 hypothetical protein SARC_01302 [Sphaeroforma arctica JP610]